METAEKSLMDMINVKDYDVSNKFQDDNQPPKSPIEYHKKRSDRMETETFYITVSSNDQSYSESLLTGYSVHAGYAWGNTCIKREMHTI